MPAVELDGGCYFFFDYFTIERIFAFLLKLEMIEMGGFHWIRKEVISCSEALLNRWKNEVQIPAEFR